MNIELFVRHDEFGWLKIKNAAREQGVLATVVQSCPSRGGADYVMLDTNDVEEAAEIMLVAGYAPDEIQWCTD